MPDGGTTLVKPVMAVILAGGEGERLSILSSVRAKPAVPFGGKYRIIDFTLSNCVNSDIDNVVVLTQYNPRSLNDHIGVGRPWDLDRNHGGVRMLQPYIARGRVAEWYRGTADAVLQNLNVIEQCARRHRPRPRRRPHLQDGLPAVRRGPSPQAGRRHDRGPPRAAGRGAPGWASWPSTRQDRGHRTGRRSRSSPRATSRRWASTCSRKRALQRWLSRGPAATSAANVIPAMIDGGARVFGYHFDGYWQDVGTIQSLLGGQHGAAGRPSGARPLRPRLGHPHPVRGARAGQDRPDGPGPPQPHQPRLRDRRHGRQLRALAGRPGRRRAPSCATRS